MTEKYDITDYLKDDKELQKAVIEELLKENAELKAENEGLKSQLDFEVQKKEVLEAENERLKAECDIYKTFYRAKHSDIKGLLLKYKQTLQEIKEIADAMYEDYSKRWDDNISEGLEQIIDLITKAESEEE